MNYEKIGNFIKEQRKAKGLTQKELAERIGLTDKAISKWERYQGCPDVSVLEILAKELDCSILEILKGRKITNEVIPITEANDYVKESMELEHEKANKKLKKIINRTLEAIIIFISVLLVYLNVIQIIYVDKEHESSIKENYRQISKQTKKIKENLELINNNQGKYSLEDYNKIKESLNEELKNIESTKIYEIIMKRQDITYKINDNFVYQILPYSTMYELIDVLDKYKERSLKDNLHMMIAGGGGISNLDYIFSYKYRLTPYEDYGEYLYGKTEQPLYEIANSLRFELTALSYLSDVVIEVGEISE